MGLRRKLRAAQAAFEAQPPEIRELAAAIGSSLGGLAIAPTGAAGIPGAGFGPGTPLYGGERGARAFFTRETGIEFLTPPAGPRPAARTPNFSDAFYRWMFPRSVGAVAPRIQTGGPVSILDQLPNVVATGLQIYGQVANAKAQAKLAKWQFKLATAGGQMNPWGLMPGAGTPYVPSTVPGATPPVVYDQGGIAVPAAYTPNAAPYVQNAGLIDSAAVAAGTVAMRATPLLRALIARLSAAFPTVATTAVASLASTLIANGIVHSGSGVAGPYARASDNALVGVRRGDLKAVKRLRAQRGRIMKAFSAAGMGARRSYGGGRRRFRRC